MSGEHLEHDDMNIIEAEEEAWYRARVKGQTSASSMFKGVYYTQECAWCRRWYSYARKMFELADGTPRPRKKVCGKDCPKRPGLDEGPKFVRYYPGELVVGKNSVLYRVDYHNWKTDELRGRSYNNMAGPSYRLGKANKFIVDRVTTA